MVMIMEWDTAGKVVSIGDEVMEKGVFAGIGQWGAW